MQPALLSPMQMYIHNYIHTSDKPPASGRRSGQPVAERAVACFFQTHLFLPSVTPPSTGFVCVLSFIFILLHAARRAMAAAQLLPKRQRYCFYKYLIPS